VQANPTSKKLMLAALELRADAREPDERLLAQQGARGVFFIVDVSSESL
jgi:hypothetical protein